MPDRERVIQHFEDCIALKPNSKSWVFVRVEMLRQTLKLLKEQEPRVLTLEEVEDALDTVVWVDRPQIRNSSLEFALMARYSRKREKTALYFIDGEKTTWRYSDYGRTWRCWSSRPTDEQRESVKWDDCREKVTEHETD